MEAGQNVVVKDESSITQTECRKKQRTKISNPYVKINTAQIIPTKLLEKRPRIPIFICTIEE